MPQLSLPWAPFSFALPVAQVLTPRQSMCKIHKTLLLFLGNVLSWLQSRVSNCINLREQCGGLLRSSCYLFYCIFNSFACSCVFTLCCQKAQQWSGDILNGAVADVAKLLVLRTFGFLQYWMHLSWTLSKNSIWKASWKQGRRGGPLLHVNKIGSWKAKIALDWQLLPSTTVPTAQRRPSAQLCSRSRGFWSCCCWWG